MDAPLRVSLQLNRCRILINHEIARSINLLLGTNASFYYEDNDAADWTIKRTNDEGYKYRSYNSYYGKIDLLLNIPQLDEYLQKMPCNIFYPDFMIIKDKNHSAINFNIKDFLC